MTGARDGAYAGLRVLDFTAMIAGPMCARMFADLGAEVVKIEPPEGDFMRSRGPLRDGEGGAHSTYYGAMNCGKRSVCLDLKKDAATAIVRELASRADVVIENFRPGVMRRLGFDHSSLAAGNPALVYCSISGYGQEGSFAERPAYAPIVHAASGYELATLAYQEGLERPLASGIFAADVLGAMNAFGGISAALYRRARTGRGELVDVTLMSSMLGLLIYECQAAQFPQKGRRPLYTATRARDGFVIITPISQANFEDMARAAGHPEWIADPRFAGNRARGENWSALMALLDKWAATRTAADCERIMREGGVPCSRYNTVAEAIASPWAAERGAMAEVRDGAGSFRVPNPPFQMGESLSQARGWVDRLGGHNREALRELGRNEAEIDRLYQEGVLCGQR
jgi:crotonobetainyl-CoA:carnitine CoA-transferase CaiB-like acyl-CoA transferase